MLGPSALAFELTAAALLNTASEISAGPALPPLDQIGLPEWPARPSRLARRAWPGPAVSRDAAMRTARVGLYLFLAPHALGMASAVIGRADRPSLRPTIVAPAPSTNLNAPVPTMTDSGVNYGG